MVLGTLSGHGDAHRNHTARAGRRTDAGHLLMMVLVVLLLMVGVVHRVDGGQQGAGIGVLLLMVLEELLWLMVEGRGRGGGERGRRGVALLGRWWLDFDQTVLQEMLMGMWLRLEMVVRGQVRMRGGDLGHLAWFTFDLACMFGGRHNLIIEIDFCFFILFC